MERRSAIRIPRQAWAHPIGCGFEPVPRPRVIDPMIDDGPWAGIPIGGIGAGSIGRTQRGDFARWHLRVGTHRFEPVAVDGFSLWVGDGERRDALVLRTTDPPPGWGPALAVGAGTYRALFPRAWFEYEPAGLPIRVVEESLSPVVPGDDTLAALPVGAYELQLETPTDRPIDAAILLSWRNDLGRDLGLEAGPGAADPGTAVAVKSEGAAGVLMRPPAAAAERGTPGSLAIVAASGPGIELTTVAGFDPEDAAGIWRAFAADGRLPDAVPAPGPGRAIAGAVAARVRLEPGATRSLRFAIAWDLPVAEFGAGRRWLRRYTREHGTAGDGAWALGLDALAQLDRWRAAIEAWQAPILDAPERPDWYQAALLNELYFLVDGGTLWADRELRPHVSADLDDEPVEPVLGLLECFDYPFYDTLDVHFYASFALARLWPELEVGISRAVAAAVTAADPAPVTIETTGATAVRKVAGAAPHDLGGPSDDPLARPNLYRFQDSNAWKDLNPKFVLQLARDRFLDPDPDGLVRAAWPAVVAAMDRIAAFDRDGDGLPDHDGEPDQTYDTWPMTGPSAYCGGLWLAALRAAIDLASIAGDGPRAAAWSATLERASHSFEARLWNGRCYDYDGGGGPTSDSVMADQLAGQWYADVLGLGDLVAPDRVMSALRHVF
ncbi:MAG TPA: non-lysosomal glucosylceramidase, partial [Candidatus Limnocylindrales bacterium]|nr:non-lysosomal glucosylceramidase [Candidatus Limnocylindrales bacterium]